MEFESLITVERRLVFINLQGFLDLTCPEAWLPSKDAYVLQAHTVACVGDVLKESRLFVAPHVLRESGTHFTRGLTYIGVFTGVARYVVNNPALIGDGVGSLGLTRKERRVFTGLW